jgi:hypothetical protein
LKKLQTKEKDFTMPDIKWLPFIPQYPNTQIPHVSELSELRVVEPSTRTSVSINLMEDKEQQLEKFKNTQSAAAVIRYTSTGDKILTTDYPNPLLIDITV